MKGHFVKLIQTGMHQIRVIRFVFRTFWTEVFSLFRHKDIAIKGFSTVKVEYLIAV